MYKHRYFIILFLALLITSSGCSGARSTFNKAQKLESEGKLDEAVMKYAEAVSENPEANEYRMRFLALSEKAARIHMEKGDKFFENGNLDEALREYQAAESLDSSLSRARQKSDKIVKLRNSIVYQKEGEELEKNRKTREALQAYQKALEFNPSNEQAIESIARIQKVRKSKIEGAELNLKSTKPITLKFKDAKLKDVFNIITQLSGINFVFDEAVKDVNISIFLENATFQQALDVISGMHKLSKKTLNENTVILYPKTPEKHKQYDDLMVQTFYLNKLDAKKAVNLIRTMLQVKKIYVNEEMNAIVIRDIPEVIEVARKILEANDIPDAEVLLEVEVIEVSKKNAEALGLVLSKYSVSMNTFTPGGDFFSDSLNPILSTINSGSAANGGTATGTPSVTGAKPSNLLNVFSWNNYNGYMTVPSATFNFGKTLSNAETLASPKIRVKNREKAKFNVGTRVPITTTSSPTGGGVSVNVQYVDVGVKVNAEPTIQLNNEVNMKLSLEVSSILSKEKIGDAASLTTVVTIGTRNVDTVLSLKDGETSVIGGLILDNSTKAKQTVMVLGDLPIIGPLLTGNDNTNDKAELILAITPRIIRGIAVPEGDAAQFWSGREDEPSIHRPYSSFAVDDEIPVEVEKAKPPQLFNPVTPKPSAVSQGKPPVTASPVPATNANPASGATPIIPIQSKPVPSPQSTQSNTSLQNQTPASKATVQGLSPKPLSETNKTAVMIPVTPAATPKTELNQKPARTSVTIAAPSSVKVKDQFMVDIKVSEVNSLRNTLFILSYDPIFLEYVDASTGQLMKSDGKTPAFKATNDKNTGQILFSISRPENIPPVSGSGKITTVTFKAKNQGPASLGLMGVNFTGQGGRQLETLPYNTVVEVK